MAEDKKVVKGWHKFTPNRESQIRVLDYPDTLQTHRIPKDQLAKLTEGLKDISMGCRVPETACPACEAGDAPKCVNPFISPDVETDGIPERIIGIDFGDDPSVTVVGVMKRLNEPNANGDVYVMESLERVAQPLDEPKVVVHGNKVADRIKKLTDQYLKTVKEDPHHIPIVPAPIQIAQVGSPNKWSKSPTFKEDVERVSYGISPLRKVFTVLLLERKLKEIQERMSWLATSPNAEKLIERHDIEREQYDLYREQQSVEAKLHEKRQEVEMNQELQKLYEAVEMNQELQELYEASEAMKLPNCPRCHDPMVLRQANRGLMEGREFFGCKNYPHCTGTRTVDEVKGTCPSFNEIRIKPTTSKGNKYLECLVISYGAHTVFGKRFRKINGDSFFQDFIEPASRAVNKSMRTIVHEVLKALDIRNPTIVAARLVSIEPINTAIHTHDSCDHQEVVDTVALDKVLKESSRIRRFLGMKEVPELHRITLERRTNVIQLRAKDERGQTMLTGELPEDHKEDMYALKELVAGFVQGLAKKVGMENETIRQILLQDLEAAQEGKFARTAALLHSAAMQINFVPRSKHENKKNYGPGMTLGNDLKPKHGHFLGQGQRHPDADKNLKITFGCTDMAGGKTVVEASRLDVIATATIFSSDWDKRTAKPKIKALAIKAARQYGTSQQHFLRQMSKALDPHVLNENKDNIRSGKARLISDIAACLADEMDELRSAAKPVRSNAMNEAFRQNYNQPPIQACASDVALEPWKKQKHLMENAYSPETQRFIQAQRKAKPGKLIQQIAEQHEQAIIDEKRAQEDHLFVNKPCKCGATAGCMCPRVEEEKDEPPCEHRFCVLIPHNIAAELGADVSKLHPDAKIYACRDCHEVYPLAPK